MKTESSSQEILGDVISSYTRRQAIADGVLVDLMQADTVQLVKDAGFRVPLAMTAAAWDAAIAAGGKWIPEDPRPRDSFCHKAREILQLALGQDLNGRLWDVLTMLTFAIKRAGATQTGLLFAVRVSGRIVHLKSVCGPGDMAEPVITIMLPDED